MAEFNMGPGHLADIHDSPLQTDQHTSLITVYMYIPGYMLSLRPCLLSSPSPSPCPSAGSPSDTTEGEEGAMGDGCSSGPDPGSQRSLQRSHCLSHTTGEEDPKSYL